MHGWIIWLRTPHLVQSMSAKACGAAWTFGLGWPVGVVNQAKIIFSILHCTAVCLSHDRMSCGGQESLSRYDVALTGWRVLFKSSK